ncbi:hypothetical protein [Sinorhizobium sp. RAC02]|uniref:hypothetical protein n=1 Tax=Sinorhizobium sp. RAC02 TaxID=1842534 RepID=UPI00083CEF5D|nr:hypothetical protein [Sinorhizobium sp. RAC02]AOF89037.1 hypothetical protein BSY16_2280 [Sinorhizobium sp. RAC02]
MRLGMMAKDVITGFSGIITGRVNYITGCDQYLLSPQSDKEPRWFDEQRLEVNEVFSAIVLDNSKGNGADVAAPIK